MAAPPVVLTFYPYLVLDGVDFGLEVLVFLRRVEEAQCDGVAGVLEGDGGVFVRGAGEVDAVHAHDLVTAFHLQDGEEGDE